MTTGGWGFTPMITTAVSAGLTSLCSIMCLGLSGNRIHSAVIVDVSTCQSAKVRAARIRNFNSLNSVQHTGTLRLWVLFFFFHSQIAEWADQKCHSDLPYICKRVNVTGTIPPTPSSPHPPSGCPDGWSSYQRKVQHCRLKHNSSSTSTAV